MKLKEYFVGIGHNQVRSDPVLTPSANQMSVVTRYGQENRRGFSAGGLVITTIAKP